MRVEVPEIPWTEEIELPVRGTAVLVVDMQNDFVDEKGALFVPTAPATIEPIRDLLSRAREGGVGVIFTQDWHSPDDPEFKIWPPHAVAGTWGAEIVPDLNPREGELVIRKTTYDPFFRTELEEILSARKIRNLVIVGTVANICVLHAAASGALRGIKVVVPRDGVSALNEFDLLAAFRQITFLYRGEAVTSARRIRFSSA